jgi:hypothetical protein
MKNTINTNNSRNGKVLYVKSTMEVCYWALLFMPLVILLYLYSLQIKGDLQKKKKKYNSKKYQ